MWNDPLAAPRPSFDTRAFRNALGCFATGVCIITTLRADGRRAGLTVNSFSSVSLEPPMVLWSLARQSPSVAAFRDAEFWAVNVLAADQAEISSHFARPSEDKFAAHSEHFTEGTHGTPLLEGAVAHFECRNQFQNYGGDHIVFIGTVEHFDCWEREPLLFHRGKYADLRKAP